MANAQAIVAAWIAYSLAPRSRYFAAERAWLAQKTNTTGAWATKNWSRAARASAARSLSRVTRKISYPCRFPADGAAFAAASTCAIFSASTASGANARTDRRLLITSNRSTTRIIPFGRPSESHVGRCARASEGPRSGSNGRGADLAEIGRAQV